jgi:hypothetical protein
MSFGKTFGRAANGVISADLESSLLDFQKTDTKTKSMEIGGTLHTKKKSLDGKPSFASNAGGLRVSSGRPRKKRISNSSVDEWSSAPNNEDIDWRNKQERETTLGNFYHIAQPLPMSSRTSETGRSSNSTNSPTPRKLSGMSPYMRPSQREKSSSSSPESHTGRVLQFGGELSEDNQEVRKEIEVEAKKAIEQNIGEAFKRERSVMGCDGCGASRPLSTLTVVKPCAVSNCFQNSLTT